MQLVAWLLELVRTADNSYQVLMYQASGDCSKQGGLGNPRKFPNLGLATREVAKGTGMPGWHWDARQCDARHWDAKMLVTLNICILK